AADPTCVLCMKCFLGSIHKEHRYRMTTSGGGGFCDCGDAEAWKKGPYCQQHRHPPTDRDAEEVRHVSLLSREDTYYCMLFNDEVHTYEQVIYTLQKAVNCSQKEAVSFATTVDRDGRKSVRYGDFQFCDQAKSVIVVSRNTSRQSKPLRVQVMHSSVVAHQCFALRALSWLGQIIQYSDGLRRVLCEVGLQRGPEGEYSSLVDKLMLNDSKMWKGARNIYHQLLMNSLLMDLKYKKIFAIQFAKNYRRLQTDFMEDDHERVVSVTSLSVQLFTVPTMARMLMVEENLMTTIIKTFVDHLRHRDLQGRFQFDRYTAQQAFKFGRVQSLIGDLKYILISRPSEWSDQLRLKFLEGLDAFLELLKCMQGMDPVVRQVGQHIEMEPEWEAAFTLQMKLTHIISMIQEWCSTDEHVLIEAYRKCLSALSHCHSGLPDGEQPISLSVAGHCVETFRYQVSQDKVSIHLPVCRLLAGLHVLLSRTEVASRFPEHPPLLIELPLRCLVLCAQVHAGMWRRNGFSLINQIYYYHNVKCRVEMFDKDMIMLQAGASMMDPNHFLMIVLSRFELFHIFSSADCRKRYRDTHKGTCVCVCVCGAGERYVSGVGQVESFDEVRREIIHQLSIRPMAHSELVKALPENGNKETGLERVIDSVASFKKPGVTGRGLYELRPEWNKHFNLYFHHFTLPPPSPPLLCPLFGSLVNLLQCDVLLAVEGAVLQWAVEPSGGGWTESMLQRVRHMGGVLDPNPMGYCPKVICTSTQGGVWRTNCVCTLCIFSLQTLRDKDKAERKRKAEMARLRREKIMAQMSEMQKHFINENKELFQQSLEELEASTSAAADNRVGGAEHRQLVTCILCQEEQEVRGQGRAMVLAAFIQRSTVLSKNRRRNLPDPGGRGLTMTLSGQRPLSVNQYFEAVQLKEQRRQQRLRGHTSYDVENGEFLCPLCECLSNTVIPLLPHTHTPDYRYTLCIGTTIHLLEHTWMVSANDDVTISIRNLFSSSVKEMITTFSMSTYKVGLKVNPNEQDQRVPVLSWSTCAYTIQSIERLLMEEDKPLFGSLPCRQVTRGRAEGRGFRGLACRRIFHLFTTGTSLCSVFLSLQVYSVLSYSSVHSLDQSGQRVVDSAHLHILHLVTVAHLVQILLTSTTGGRLSVLPEVTSGWQLFRCVKAGCLPFLRATALFFHYLNSTAPPADLLVAGPGQWEALCSYLDLPSNLLQLHQNQHTLLEPLIHRWCCHPVVRQTLQVDGVIVRFPRESNRLIQLPEDYSILINQASSFTCPRSGGDKSRAPTLCLVCGSMLCSQSYCCQTEVDGEDVGACTAHTFTCGAGLGLFLRVRESQVLFVFLLYCLFVSPPVCLFVYLFTLCVLKRGNPLHLCAERYRKIERLWRQHGIAEVIGHAQEANQTLVAIDWQHL
uniref:E3 ubiquitin-protein ligase n=1 Tax=Cyclopterus lumpus TaxID=8103 RepID=A0A8C3G3V9_CYCLU